MDVVVQFVTAPAPLWVAGLLVLGAFAAGRWYRRAAVADARQRAQVAERQARYATRRAESAEQAADAVTRALPAEAWPEPVSETLPPRGAGLDVRRTDELVAASSLGTPEAVQARRSVSPDGDETAPPDEEEGEVGRKRYDPAPPDSPTVTFAAVLPRYDWSAAGWTPGSPAAAPPVPPPVGVPPRGYGWLSRAWTAARAYLVERWEAVWPRQTELWRPGELTGDLPPLTAVGRVEVPGLMPGDDPYKPRHGFAEVPPSIAAAFSWMTPTERARELVRQLGQSGWWPWTDVADRRTRVALRAWAIARRHGRRPLLGTFTRIGVLP